MPRKVFWEDPYQTVHDTVVASVQALVDADAPIISAFEDEARERRCWEVAGFARVPCGGTHLKRTGEVGGIRLKRDNIGGGKERIEIFLD